MHTWISFLMLYACQFLICLCAVTDAYWCACQFCIFVVCGKYWYWLDLTSQARGEEERNNPPRKNAERIILKGKSKRNLSLNTQHANMPTNTSQNSQIAMHRHFSSRVSIRDKDKDNFRHISLSAILGEYSRYHISAKSQPQEVWKRCSTCTKSFVWEA